MPDIYSDTRQRVYRNAALCRRCNTEIESRYQHHFVQCACEGSPCFVDGGLAYLRSGWTNLPGDPEGGVLENRSEAYDFEFAVMKIDGEEWVEVRLLEPEDIRVRRRVKPEELTVLQDPTAERFDSMVGAFTAWRVLAENALAKKLREMRS